MLDPNRSPWTAHTTVPVNLTITGEVLFKDKFINGIEGKLGDIAPTILKLVGIVPFKEFMKF